MNGCLSVCGLTCLAIPARRLARATIRAAPCRSSRFPSEVTNSGPSERSPIARSIALAVRGASGTVTTLPPLRVMTRVRWPRSRPRCSMPAPAASETRSPLRASREISAWSAGGPSPAATRMAPSSLRSRAVACDSQSSLGRRTCAAGECWRSSSSTAYLQNPAMGAQPPGDGGAGPAARFQVAGEGLDAGAPDREQGHRAGTAPPGELAQVESAGVSGQAATYADLSGRATPRSVVKAPHQPRPERAPADSVPTVPAAGPVT